MANDIGQSFGWDGEIDAVENEFELMEPGEYLATVENVERQQFNGSDKMCACPIAKVERPPGQRSPCSPTACS